MQANIPTSSQTLLDGVVAVIRQQVIADMAAAEGKTNKKTQQARLLTVDQAGVYIARTPGAVRQLIHKRQIPVVRFGRSVRIDVRDLDKMIEDNRV